MARIFRAIVLALLLPAAASARTLFVAETSIDQLQAMMTAGQATSVALTRAYLKRIAAMDRKGPALHSIIALNPDALAQARALDGERRAGHVRGPLHGVPILIKDNIETADRVATTAGSLALRANITGRDAPVVANLRRAGAVILGKTNLSEWANIRSRHAMSGWSAVGGLVKNPYVLDRTACGSSSGAGVAVAVSFAAAAVGTETDGSVVCPSSINGIVGMKPSLGLVSRTRVVPVSHSQDTPGPMARSVRDVAIMLSAMSGPDEGDPVTARTRPHDFAAELTRDGLEKMRVGVIWPDQSPPQLNAQYLRALDALRSAGATLVAVRKPGLEALGANELIVLKTELKAGLNAYLASTPDTVTTRSLTQVITFNRANAAVEMPFFAQDLFEDADRSPGLGDPAYQVARQKSLRLASVEGIDAMLKAARAQILVEPTYGPAWLSDPIYGDQYSGPSASELPAIAGYPHLTVPMGLVDGLPVGISFIATKDADALVLRAGYAFEQRLRARVAPLMRASIASGPAIDGTK